MPERRRLYFLILLIAAAALLVCGAAVYLLYEAALAHQEQQLVEMVKSQARLMEAMTLHERQEHPGRARDGLLREVAGVIHNAFERYPGFGQSGAFMVARREADRIVFQSAQRVALRGHPESVPFEGTRAEPMRRALKGLSGAMVAADYRGNAVLAAYEPVRELDLGLVAKIDLAEVRTPYVHAGAIAGLLAAAAVVLGGVLVLRTAEPVLQRMRERRAMLATAQAMAHMGCWSFDIPASKVVWSDELYRLFGYEPGSCAPSYEMYVSHIHPEDRPRVVAAIAEARARGDSMHYSYRLRRADGVERIVESHSQTFTNDRGEVIRLFGVTQDVTERREAEERVRDMARFPEQSPHPVMRTRRDGTLIYGNKASESLRDRLGIQTGGPLPPEWMAVLTDAVKAQSSRTFEVACEGRHFMFVVWPIANADYVNFYGMDITEREQAKAALRASEERYRMLMEDAADAIFIADPQGNYVSVNAKACELLGYTREELLRMNLRDVIQAGNPPSRHEELRNGSPLLTERRLRRKDGGLVQTEISAKALPDGRLQAIVRDITERVQAQEQLQFLAHHDGLTELPNRVLFLDRFKQALAHARWHERGVAVIFLDLDGFKDINDSLGHDVGDLLLQQFAARLRTCVRDRDTVARLGGDEFAILLDDLASAGDIGPVAEKVLDAFAAPFVAGSRGLSLTASLGISLYPNDGEDAGTLLKCADTAMYRAKSQGKNNFQFYSPV